MDTLDLVNKLDKSLIARQTSRGVDLQDAKAFARGYVLSTLASIIDRLPPKEQRLAVQKITTLIALQEEAAYEDS